MTWRSRAPEADDVVTRRAAQDRWRSTQRSLASKRAALDQKLRELKTLDPHAQASVLDVAERLSLLVAGSQRLRERESALERLFQRIPADDRRAGPKLIELIDAFETVANDLRVALSEQLATLDRVQRAISEIQENRSALSAPEFDDLIAAATRGPDSARHLLASAVRRNAARRAAVQLSRAALQTRIDVGVRCAEGLERTDPQHSESLLSQLLAIGEQGRPVASDDDPRAWPILREQHSRLDATLGPSLARSFGRMREQVGAACRPGFERLAAELDQAEPTSWSAASATEVNRGLRVLSRVWGKSWFRTKQTESVRMLLELVSRPRGAFDQSKRPDTPHGEVTDESPPISSAWDIVARLVVMVETNLRFVIAALPADATARRDSTFEGVISAWAFLPREYTTTDARTAIDKVFGFKRAVSERRRLTTGQARVCLRYVEELTRLWALPRPREFDSMAKILGTN